MSEIGPGTPLICKSAAALKGHEVALTEGALYACSEVRPAEQTLPSTKEFLYCSFCNAIKEHDFLRVRGQVVWYCPQRFRPLNDGDTSLVENEVYHQLTNLPKVEWKTLETIDE